MLFSGLFRPYINSSGVFCFWGYIMFSLRQKRNISDAVQKILRDTNHPELPIGEIRFLLHIDGVEPWSWADIKNNSAIDNPSINPWNEMQDRLQKRRE